MDTASLSLAASPCLAAFLRQPLPTAAALLMKMYDANAELLGKNAATLAQLHKFSLGPAGQELAARALAASLEEDPELLNALLCLNKGKHEMASLAAIIASRGPESGSEVPEGAGVYAHTLEVFEKEYSDKTLARARVCMGEKRAARLAVVEAGVAVEDPPGLCTGRLGKSVSLGRRRDEVAKKEAAYLNAATDRGYLSDHVLISTAVAAGFHRARDEAGGQEHFRQGFHAVLSMKHLASLPGWGSVLTSVPLLEGALLDDAEHLMTVGSGLVIYLSNHALAVSLGGAADAVAGAGGNAIVAYTPLSEAAMPRHTGETHGERRGFNSGEYVCLSSPLFHVLACKLRSRHHFPSSARIIPHSSPYLLTFIFHTPKTNTQPTPPSRTSPSSTHSARRSVPCSIFQVIFVIDFSYLLRA